MEAARPHQCQALHSNVLHIKALAMTGADGQMFASCFNCTVKKRNQYQPPPLALNDSPRGKGECWRPPQRAAPSPFFYFRPLKIAPLNFRRVDKPIINVTIIRHGHVLLKRALLER